MATKEVVPNADGEGSLGTASLKWGDIHTDSLSVGGTTLASSLETLQAGKAGKRGVYFDGSTGAFTADMYDIGTDDFSVALDVTLPDTLPSTNTALWLATSSSSAAVAARSYYLALSTTGTLILSIRGASASDLVRLESTTAVLSGSLGDTVNLVVSADRSTDPAVYLNGAALVFNETTGGTPPSWSDTVTSTYFWLARSDSNYIELTANSCAIINYAITAADALSIYEQGLGAWAAQGKRGGALLYEPDYATETGILSVVNVTATANVDAVSDGTTSYDDTVEVLANATTGQFTWSTNSEVININQAETYSIQFKYYIPSGTNITNIRAYISGTGLTLFGGGTSTFGVTGTWVTVNQTGVLTSSVSNSGRLVFYFNTGNSFTGDGVNDKVYFKDFKVERVGTAAEYHFDEGVGYQVHDVSGNKRDGLLTATGTAWTHPKKEGYIRDFNVDAYNGGSGDVELVSSTRTVLPAGAIRTEAVTVNNTSADVGQIEIEHAATGGASAAPLSVIASGYNSGIDGARQSMSLIEASAGQTDALPATLITSTDTDATDLDVYVYYKITD